MRVFLADDHNLVRAGLKALLDERPNVQIVGEASDGREALEGILKFRPDLALLDITMPGLNGLELAKRVLKESQKTKILILSMHADEGYVAQALKLGVSGYILKDAAAAELDFALDTIAKNEIYLSPSISHTVVSGFLHAKEDAYDPLAILTNRQREILQLIAEGNNTKEIAAILDVSSKTIEAHRAQIFERLNIRDIPGLVRFAIRTGLISVD